MKSWDNIKNRIRDRYNSTFNIFKKINKVLVAGSPVVISKQVVWTQPIDTRPYEIDRLYILFGTFQRSNRCTININILSITYEVIYSETFSADVLVDNSFYMLKLSEEFTYKGECYLAITSPDATSENCVAIWTEVDQNGAGLREVAVGSCGFSQALLAGEFQKHVGVKMVTKLGRKSRQGDLRNYLRHGYENFDVHSLPNLIGSVGFTADELQQLMQLGGAPAPNLHVVEADQLELLPPSKALLVSSRCEVKTSRLIARFARRRMIPLIVVELGNQSIDRRLGDAWPSFADGVISKSTLPISRLPQAKLEIDLASAVQEIIHTYKIRQMPKVSIVTIMSGKAEQLKWVIKSYFDQTYRGEIEVVYIHDCFGEAESEVATEFEKNYKTNYAPSISYTILRNERNMGNCASRNRGVAAATGDIIVVIDADCMLNKQFIAAHVDAHSYLDCEVVIGPHNIETNGTPPFEKLMELEGTPTAPIEESELQDTLCLDSFLNCITRNFSIKKTAIVENLFDVDFSYTLSPETGFGWEDVEMGYRLYKRALGIKFTHDAFSVHISHGSSMPEELKPRKSILNFQKLFLKHPELRDVARRWSVKTLGTLEDWSKNVDSDHTSSAHLSALNELFEEAPNRIEIGFKQKRKLRILTYRWHVPHQYELYKSGHDFFLVRGTGSPMCDQWELGHRPLPSNATFINIEDVEESQFDLAILHFDENVLNYENTNGNLGPDWGAAFRYFVEQVNLPKVAVCHGTPQFYGQYTPGYDKPDLMSVIEPARAALVAYVKDIEVVCNSHQARREWGFHKSRVIWHGFDPAEFLPSTYERGILSPLGPLVKSRPHYRGFYLYQEVFSTDFPEQFLPETLSVPDPDIDYTDNIYAIGKYKNYVDQIRKYSIYFNPTLRSPMPRARCEPMMCGVVTVNANNHDVDMFIRNGINGFYSNEPDELREQLIYLMKNPGVTGKIGLEARKTAISVFNHDRYLADWSKLIYLAV